MTADRDLAIDRRKLKRRLVAWQLLALGLLALIAYAILGNWSDTDGRHIARVSISGTIVDDFDREAMLERLSTDSMAQAVIVRINSPGGTVAGSEALYNGLREIAKSKPVASFISTIGASGGYIVALGSDHIVARQNALTGSIGVIFQAPEFSGLFEKIGVTVQEVKTSPIKGGPSPYRPMSDEQRAVVQGMADDAYNWFVGIVADRRGMDLETAKSISDGRVYTGRQAKENGLVDALGSERDAIDWLQAQDKIDANLPVIDVEPADKTTFLFGRALAWLGIKSEFTNGLALDGMLALWQP